MSVVLCGPAKGTKAKPYRCICCGECYANIDAIEVSICWKCMTGNTRCKACRERGIWISDCRLGKWPDDLSLPYDPEGGLGHRLVGRTLMACGVRIPHKHWGGGEAVVPPCPQCWPEQETHHA